MLRNLLMALDNVRLALSNLRANTLRSLLTLLGIVIGVATVVSMMALIEGLRLKVNEDLSSLGADVFSVTKWPVGFGRHNWRKYSRRPDITLGDRDALMLGSTLIKTVSAEEDKGGLRISTPRAETRPDVQVSGVTSDYTQTAGLTVAHGRFIGEADMQDARRVIVIGVDVADILFPGVQPVGQEVRMSGRTFQVIGVLDRRGSFLGLVSLDNMVVIPLSTFLDMYGHRRSLNLNVQVAEADRMEEARDEVTMLLRQRRRLSPFQENDFEIFTNDTMTDMFNQLSAVITAASFGVCLLSLIVGGIGILNIMLVSVTERTREIGIRKALGARRRRILAQFATEAVVLAFLGGLIGVLAGYGVAFLGRWALQFPTHVPSWAVVLSLIMSSVVGLVFGIYPAARAARLDPVDAMRAE